ncbi:protein of unknown function [Pseudomonas sp. JV551A1]|uniref:Uncharacterized protein n=1 Tax=Pseudomonas inefficax TaxID=2078786 RepID=A0AAQ1SU52_9PSED|nr:protein of unknown function [Pseudomonas sp. JV551A1]SPO61374.1 protein of unknown function [Pseudomonas inefficax]
MWERPCVAKGLQSSPSNYCSVADYWGCYAALSRHKAAPTATEQGFAVVHNNKNNLTPYTPKEATWPPILPVPKSPAPTPPTASPGAMPG